MSRRSESLLRIPLMPIRVSFRSFMSGVFLLLPLFFPFAWGMDVPAPGKDSVLEQRLLPLRQKAEQGDPYAAQQLYMRYAMAGHTDLARSWALFYNSLLAGFAQKGDVDAMLQLGSRYLRGTDYTPYSLQDATTWFSRAAEAGDPTGAYMLGEIYSRAGNTPLADRAYADAYAIYSERAKSGSDAQALYWTGYMLQNGIGTQRDPEAGLRTLRQAAELGSPWALEQLFKSYYNGIGTPKNHTTALSFARKLADEHKNTTMAYIVACAYFAGKDVPRDDALGEHYLDLAARGNIPDAVYLKSNRLEQLGKFDEARPFLRQAASMHQRDAMLRLGSRMLAGSDGIPHDTERGIFLLEAAAHESSPQAALLLAKYYEDADEQAIADSWYITASDLGSPSAMARRGLLHLIPNSSVSWNPTRCYQWWRTGASLSDPTCTLYLRLFYYVFIPLLLLLTFAVPAYIGYKARKNKIARASEANS